MYVNFLPGRQRVWSARSACLFSQDSLKGAGWKIGVTALCVGGGICFNPQWGCACTHAILLMWADMERPQMMSMAVYTGCGRWSRAVFWPDLALGGRGYSWLAPLPLTGSCTHVTIRPLKTKYSMLGFLHGRLCVSIGGMTSLGLGGGYFCHDPPSPPDWVLHICMRAFWPTVWWIDVERPYANVHSNFKIKYQKYTFIWNYFLRTTSSDLCLRTQLAISISL